MAHGQILMGDPAEASLQAPCSVAFVLSSHPMHLNRSRPSTLFDSASTTTAEVGQARTKRFSRIQAVDLPDPMRSTEQWSEAISLMMTSFGGALDLERILTITAARSKRISAAALPDRFPKWVFSELRFPVGIPGRANGQQAKT
jgi:hypothetical protein